MARSLILLFVVMFAAYGKLITHTDEIHPNYRLQLPKLGDCLHDPIWEEVLHRSFPQFDAVLHETEDGRLLVGFLDRFSPGKLIIWTYFHRPPQGDPTDRPDGGGVTFTTGQELQPTRPGGPGDPGTPDQPGGTDPDAVHSPEPATFALVGLVLLAVGSTRFKRG